MELDYQTLFNAAIAITSGAIGWIVNVMWNAIKDMQKSDKELAEKVSAVEVLVAGQYVTRAEHANSFERVERALNRIEDKLDGKADK